MVQLLRLPRKAVTIICLHSSILCITPLNDQIPIAHLSKVLLYQIIVQNEAEKSEGKHHAGRRAVKESNLNKVLLHVLPTGWNFIEMWRYASIIIILCQYRVGGGSGELRQLPHVALAGAEGGSDEGRARSGIQRRWWGNVELPDRPPSFGMGLLEFVIWWATTAISGKRWRSAALDRRAEAPVAAGCGEGSARVRRCAGDGGEVQVATGPPIWLPEGKLEMYFKPNQLPKKSLISNCSTFRAIGKSTK